MLRVSARTTEVDDPPVALVQRWVADRRFDANMPLIDVSQAAPSEPAARALREYLGDLVRRDDTGKYAPTLGLPATRAAIAHHIGRSHIRHEHVMVTAGCNQAFCLAIGALCEPGDEVVIPTPLYFNHAMWLDASGVRAITVPSSPSNGMLPDLDAIERAISKHTRAIVFVTPNNPCGVVYSPELIEAAFLMAQRHNVALILDETYREFRSSTAPPHRLFERSDWTATLVQLLSFSKTLSLAGYRVGALVASPHVLREAAKLADCQTISAPGVGQEAVTFGLTHLGEWVERQRCEMQARIGAFLEAARCLDGYNIISTGAFFSWVQHPFVNDSSVVVAQRLADNHNVLTIPGSCFGPHEDRFLRLAFGNITTSDMPMLVERLRCSL